MPKKYTWEEDPVTGEEYKQPKAGYTKDHDTGRIRKMTESEKEEQRIRQILVGVAVIIVGVIVLWNRVILPWIQANTVLATLIGASIVTLAGYLGKRYADEHDVVKETKDLINDLTPRTPVTQHEPSSEAVKTVMDDLDGMDVQSVRDEEDFEKQLYQRLHAQGHSVQRQHNFHGRLQIDLYVNNHIGIEVKIAESNNILRSLAGQVDEYKDHLDKLLVVILDVNQATKLNYWTEKIKGKDPENIDLLVITGDVNRRDKQVEYITVKKETRRV